MKVMFERVQRQEQLEADAEWWQIYEASFPAPYRASRAALLRVFAHPMVLFVRGHVDGKTVALATVQMLVEPAMGFLGYLGVAPEARDGGVGRQLLAAGIRMTEEGLRAKGHEPLGMLLECEFSPAGSRTSAAAWFARDRFLPLKCAYEQPPLSPSDVAVPMQLLFRSRVPGLQLTPAFAISAIKALYEQKYGTSYGVPAAVLEELLRRCADPLGVDAYRKSS